VDLALVLQRLYDSEINVTITWLWDDGFDFALVSYMEWEDAGKPIDYMEVVASVGPRVCPDGPNPWHGVARADELASAIHNAALSKYPESDYAKLYGRPN
jgi:hypothetical protein